MHNLLYHRIIRRYTFLVTEKASLNKLQVEQLSTFSLQARCELSWTVTLQARGWGSSLNRGNGTFLVTSMFRNECQGETFESRTDAKMSAPQRSRIILFSQHMLLSSLLVVGQLGVGRQGYDSRQRNRSSCPSVGTCTEWLEHEAKLTTPLNLVVSIRMRGAVPPLHTASSGTAD
jgi:hypothetical protein